MESLVKDTSLIYLKDILHIISSVCSQFKIVSLNRQIEIFENINSGEQLIDVAVLGQFKAGKSSFINSLLGMEVLPTGVIPVTTVITRLQYGEQKRCIVEYLDCSKRECEFSDIEGLISEAKNKDNEKQVKIVDIELPYLKKFPGIRIVDTPGLGSVFKDHMETSKNWLPEVGIALVAISSDRPLSDADILLLRDLEKHTPRIALLLTKIDRLSEDQLNEVVQFFKKTIDKEFGREFPVFTYSTIAGTEVLRQKLERDILNPLCLDRDKEFEKIFQHKMMSLLKACIGYLEIALKTSLKADEEREILKKKILDEKVNYDLIREEIELIVNENQRKTRMLINTYLEKFLRPLIRTLIERLLNDMNLWQGNLWNLTRKFETWVINNVGQEIRDLSDSEKENFFGTMKKTNTMLLRSIETLKNNINYNVRKVLGTRLSDMEWNMEIAEPTPPRIDAYGLFLFQLDSIWFLIPMKLFRKVFEKRFVEKIPGIVEIALSRLAAQWEKSINNCIGDMGNQSMLYVKEEIETIEYLLLQHKDQAVEIREWINELLKHLTFLKRYA